MFRCLSVWVGAALKGYQTTHSFGHRYATFRYHVDVKGGIFVDLTLCPDDCQLQHINTQTLKHNVRL
jgi:hypothetical protein